MLLIFRKTFYYGSANLQGSNQSVSNFSSVVNTGGKLPQVSMTPAANLPPVSGTPVATMRLISG
jgi:hypothetical protein